MLLILTNDTIHILLCQPDTKSHPPSYFGYPRLILCQMFIHQLLFINMSTTIHPGPRCHLSWFCSNLPVENLPSPFLPSLFQSVLSTCKETKNANTVVSLPLCRPINGFLVLRIKTTILHWPARLYMIQSILLFLTFCTLNRMAILHFHTHGALPSHLWVIEFPFLSVYEALHF